MRGRVYLEDNWQQSSRLTLNLGLRYELALPYVETNGRMANLDVTPAFTNAAVVTPGASGPYTGEFPAGLVNTDWGNVGPRIGVAYRLARNTIVRGGYSITYNNSSYATIARQLVGQPPWAETETNIGSLEDPLTIADGLVTATATTTNNFGVDKNYGLGLIQTWNATRQPGPAAQLHDGGRLHRHERDEPRSAARAEPEPRWLAAHPRRPGVHLGIGRRTLEPAARELPVEAAAHEGIGCGPELHAGEVDGQRVVARRRRPGGGAERSGSGRGVGLVEFRSTAHSERGRALRAAVRDRPQVARQRWMAGRARRRLDGRCDVHGALGLAVHRARGERDEQRRERHERVAPGRLLRRPMSRSPIRPCSTSSIPARSRIPAAGLFGTAPRNSIIGPGGHVTNAVFSRDMRVRGNQTVTLQVNANNLFNTIQWTSIDTNINSRTFGYVTRFSPMRTVTLNLRYRF